jgi:hypothetical protein
MPYAPAKPTLTYSRQAAIFVKQAIDAASLSPAYIAACQSKNYYPTAYQAAQSAAHKVRKGYVMRLWIYHCQCCRGWHLTSHNQGSEYEISRHAYPRFEAILGRQP